MYIITLNKYSAQHTFLSEMQGVCLRFEGDYLFLDIQYRVPVCFLDQKSVILLCNFILTESLHRYTRIKSNINAVRWKSAGDVRKKIAACLLRPETEQDKHAMNEEVQLKEARSAKLLTVMFSVLHTHTHKIHVATTVGMLD